MKRQTLYIFLALFSLSTAAKNLPCEALVSEPNLRSLGLTGREAIRRIVDYLAVLPMTAEEKYKTWQDLVHRYNTSGHEGFIISPCLKSADGDFVCWGQTRGNLLVFRAADGAVFSGYNPLRPNPQQGYHVDWSDPTLKMR